MGNDITLYGASGHGKVVIDIVKSISGPNITIIDDNPKTDTILGIPVHKTSDQVGSSRVDLQACKLEYSIVSPK